MPRKTLEQKVCIDSVDNGEGIYYPMELEYYLLESESNGHEELQGKKVYGIEIVKKVGNTNMEQELVWNLSCCRENTQNILNKLAAHTVTPVGLPFVLDDLIGI